MVMSANRSTNIPTDDRSTTERLEQRQVREKGGINEDNSIRMNGIIVTGVWGIYLEPSVAQADEWGLSFSRSASE